MLLSSSADATHNALLWLYWRSAASATAVAADDDATNAEAKVKVASVDITIADATF